MGDSDTTRLAELIALVEGQRHAAATPIVPLASHHGVAALLAARADELDLDTGEMNQLRRIRKGTLAKNLLLNSVTQRAQAAFSAWGVAAVFYKGPVLAAQYYGGIDLRQSSDQDVMIRPAELGIALEALRQHGFTADWDVFSCDIEHLKKFDFEVSLTFEGQTIDLHWAPVARSFAVTYELADSIGRRTMFIADGAEVPVFRPEDLLIILTMHGTKHAWSRLIWLFDVRNIVRSPGLDWDRIRRQARTAGISTQVASVLLACERLGLLENQELRSAAIPVTARAKWLSKLVSQGLGEVRNASEGIRGHWFFAASRDHLTQSLGHVGRYITHPGAPDWRDHQDNRFGYWLARTKRVAAIVRRAVRQ